MKLASISANYPFSSKTSSPAKVEKKTSSDKNPVSRAGEVSLLVKSTFVGGLLLGGKSLFEVFDGDFIIDSACEEADEIVENGKRNVSGIKKDLMKLGATIGIIGAAVGIFALIYTCFNAPKIAYNSKVNKFVKGKKMDVYIKSNEAERELYSQLNDKAKISDEKEKNKLREQYMQLKLAKNQVPDFVKNYKI